MLPMYIWNIKIEVEKQKKNAGEENDTHKAKAESKFLSF